MIVATFAFTLTHATFAQVTRFSPDGCEFSVEFPDKPDIRSIHVAGKTGKLAASKPYPWGQLSAECWPLKKPVDVSEYAKGLEDQLIAQDFSIKSITSSKEKRGPVVLLLATTKIQGKTYNLATETHFGKNSRMEAKIIQIEFSGMEHDERFRKSITAK